ncbi:MAG: polysaccharide biosynthesis protein [Planctomycetes bacterium]|nr:polysaccharide biosynthesis protein [Planctomycetota bacterium]
MSPSIPATLDRRPLPPEKKRWAIEDRVGRWIRRVAGSRPRWLLVPATLAVGSAAWCLAYFLRYEFSVPAPAAAHMAYALPFVLLVQCISFYANGVFRILWPYVGIRDAFVIFRGAAWATAALYAVDLVFLPPGIVPRSVLLLDGILVHLGVSGLFLLLRGFREWLGRRESGPESAVPAVIIGAGDSGDTLLREVERAAGLGMRVVGFLDDDQTKHGCLLRGIPVLGGVKEIQRIVLEYRVRHALVAIPSAGGAALRGIVAPLMEANVSVKVLPSLNRLSTTLPLLSQLKDVAIEELLRRDPIRVDQQGIAEFLRDKCVLVTGAAGSIGSELCRRILHYHPRRLVAFDLAETPLHELMLELRTGHGERVTVPELGDVTDPVRVRTVFVDHAPDVVFHAAALKHVPVCEDHPREAIRVNVGGTKVIADQAMRSGVGRFILISTDKAVNPSCVMGATKRTAELLLQALNAQRSPTRFVAVRFGNVLGSNGSVLRIFKAQLARGGPLTVTHPDMCRYFMTIPEGVELVLQAAILGHGGEVFELDMGSPVRIVDLAEDLIRLSGRRPGRDVKIVFTGVRPGEKLFEELYLNTETVVPTSHPKVFCLKAAERPVADVAFQLCLDRLGPINSKDDPVLYRLKGDFGQMLQPAGVEGVSVR